MIEFAHIINPVIVEESSDLYQAQPITFETMRNAKEAAKGHVDVKLFSAQYSEDRSLVPDEFTLTPDLQKSICDYGSFRTKRKLPLIKDILDRLYDVSNAEYFIYTNVDIAVMPFFYLAINEILDLGYDSFTINRRTISAKLTKSDRINLVYAELGESHPGHDCFIFRREMYPKFDLGHMAIGVNWVGRILLWNLISNSQEFRECKDKHLTFHIGNDKQWKSKDFADYAAHNKKEALEILGRLERQYGDLHSIAAFRPYLDGLDKLWCEADNPKTFKQALTQKIFPNIRCKTQ